MSLLFKIAATRPVLLDGAMGTELMARGLPRGACPESWNLERPDAVASVHADYYAAGSDAVCTNSFGGSRIRLTSHGLEGRAYEINAAAARLARGVAPAGRFVLGSIGPTGKFLKPQGEFTEEEFEDSFAEQARGLADGGADVLLLETHYDLREALAGLRAARRTTALPVIVTMTFSAHRRGFFTFMGDSVAKCAGELERAGAAAVGANCTLSSEEMVGLVRAFREATGLPLVAQANAGQPVLGADGSATYSQSVEDYVIHVPALVEAGARLVGGCCGTGPAHIRAMARAIVRGGTP